MGHDDEPAPVDAEDRSPTRTRGRATDGRPFVMVLAVAPWTTPAPPVADDQVPSTTTA